MTHLLILAAGMLLVVGFAWSMRTPAPSIFSNQAAPVDSGELWRLNP